MLNLETWTTKLLRCYWRGYQKLARLRLLALGYRRDADAVCEAAAAAGEVDVSSEVDVAGEVDAVREIDWMKKHSLDMKTRVSTASLNLGTL